MKELKPGPGLDHLIAYEVMRENPELKRHYSTSLPDAWLIIKRLNRMGFSVVVAIRDDGQCGVHISKKGESYSAEASSPEMAICQASLKMSN